MWEQNRASENLLKHFSEPLYSEPSIYVCVCIFGIAT